MRQGLAAVLLFAAAGLPAQAAKPHVHGLMAVDVVVDGTVLVVHLHAPQDSLVGHERRPRPGAEAAAASAALLLLRDAPRWLRPDAAAACVPGAVALEAGRLDPAAAPARPGAPESAHADVEARVEWRCQAPAALRGIDVLLFDAFPRAERIDVQVAGARGPARQRLKRGSARVRLAD